MCFLKNNALFEIGNISPSTITKNCYKQAICHIHLAIG